MRFGYSLLAMSMIAGCAPVPIVPVQYAQPSEPEILRSLELRKWHGLPVPTSSTIIYIDSIAVHHTYNEASTIIWRDASGAWHWSQAREVGPGGLFPVERKLESFKEVQLSVSQGRLLDELIRSSKLYGGEVLISGHTSIGAPFHIMSITSPQGHVTIRWSARLLGDAGAIADIALGAS